MKKCSKCGKLKNVSEFCKDSKCKDGLQYYCKECTNIAVKVYQKTKEGLTSRIYGNQRLSSKRRNHPLPSYTLNELREWLFSLPLFHELYDSWKASGYDRWLAPSCDRKSDYKPYSLDNLQLMTWKENNQKGYNDMRNGINNKNSKAIIGVHEDTGDIIEFYSAHEAFRQTGIHHSAISQCCSGNYSHAGGYIWKHK